MSTQNEHAIEFSYLLRLADNALLLGQQLGALVGHGPELEEEMATANFALDYIGQARLLYSLASEFDTQKRDEDQLAYLRDSLDFQNLLLTEQPNGNFAQTLARQYYFESFYLEQLKALSQSSNQQLADIAVKAEKEIHYHLRHARQWLIRLGDGTELSAKRMQSALDELWQFTGEMFSADEIDLGVTKSGFGVDPGSLKEAWLERVKTDLTSAKLTLPDGDWMASGGKQGRHSEHHGYILAEMQFLQRSYPNSSW